MSEKPHQVEAIVIARKMFRLSIAFFVLSVATNIAAVLIQWFR